MLWPRSKKIILFLSIALVATWVSQQERQAPVKPEITVAPDTFNWQTVNSTTWQIDRQSPEQQIIIQTEQWQYNETAKHSVLKQPNVVLFHPQQITTLRSDKGESQQDTQLTLTGNVIITQYRADNNKQASQLRTPQISYDSKNASLQTHDTITIQQPFGTTTGIGLEANIETGQYKILSNVQGIYHSNPQK